MGVQCYELFGGIALIITLFYVASVAVTGRLNFLSCIL